jgi:N-acetylmuramoyl-L-alanine amidase
LQFAREFKELLLRDGRFQVVMTRESDHFVPLETRISIARAAEADLFLSLHADALSEGEAVGVTLYSLSDEASDAASAALAERHERDDLLAGVDLTAQDDMVASVLMDMARTETMPRIERLADALETPIASAELTMHRRPHQKAGFSVLKSPDIPSLLIELGFMSSAADLERLNDPVWRANMAEALRQGIVTWAEAEAAIRDLSVVGD